MLVEHAFSPDVDRHTEWRFLARVPIGLWPPGFALTAEARPPVRLRRDLADVFAFIAPIVSSSSKIRLCAEMRFEPGDQAIHVAMKVRV